MGYAEGSALRLPLKGHCPLRIPFLLAVSPKRGRSEQMRGS